MSTKKKQTGLRLEESTYRKIKFLSDNDDRSINKYLEIVIDRYLSDYERQHGEIHPDQ